MKLALGRASAGERGRRRARRRIPTWPVSLRGVVPAAGAPLAARRRRGRAPAASASSSAGRRRAPGWVGAVRAGEADPRPTARCVEPTAADWGLAARGAVVEPGGPAAAVPRSTDVTSCWTDRAAALYAQAAAAQWDPATAIDWSAPIDHGDAVEAAVVQVMTFLVENEEAALVVPARFLGQVHPHFREIQQVLARHRRRRGPPHRGVHPAGHADRPRRSPSRPSAAGRRCRRCSTSPTSPSPRSCCR